MRNRWYHSVIITIFYDSFYNEYYTNPGESNVNKNPLHENGRSPATVEIEIEEVKEVIYYNVLGQIVDENYKGIIIKLKFFLKVKIFILIKLNKLVKIY